MSRRASGSPQDELDILGEIIERPLAPLTRRERQVLQLAADGLTGPSIAERLILSPATVKSHFEHIYEKLEVRDRAAAVARGLRLALIT